MKKMGYNDLVLELKLKENAGDVLANERAAHREAVSNVKISSNEESKPIEEKKFKTKNQFIPVKDLSDCGLSYVATEGEIFDIQETKTKTE